MDLIRLWVLTKNTPSIFKVFWLLYRHGKCSRVAIRMPENQVLLYCKTHNEYYHFKIK